MARAKKCRYGKLKNPKGRRVCRRKPRRGGRGKAARRRTSGRCRYGKLKNPTGGRRCKKRRAHRVRRGLRSMSKAAQENAMWKAYKAGSLGRYGRRLRRRR